MHLTGVPSFKRTLWLVTSSPVLAGCAAGAPAAPSVPMFGAYFPFWLICAAAGVIGAVLVRVVLIRLGIDEGLPLRLFVYCCIAAAIGVTLALLLFGR